jgi:hypothetical protein
MQHRLGRAARTWAYSMEMDMQHGRGQAAWTRTCSWTRACSVYIYTLQEHGQGYGY